MKIGVLSDTHGKLDITASAIHLLRERGAKLILHCGDIDSVETVRLFRSVQTHFVFGNWDHSLTQLKKAIRDIDGEYHDGPGLIELAGRRIGWLHGHIHGEGRKLETGGELDFLFYGHSHKVEAHRNGKTLVLNPGALHRALPKTVALVDLVSATWEILAVSTNRG
jgi:putative phosphoesterase